jgi:hypothetical protein
MHPLSADWLRWSAIRHLIDQSTKERRRNPFPTYYAEMETRIGETKLTV